MMRISWIDAVIRGTILISSVVFPPRLPAQDASWLQQNHQNHPDRAEGLIDEPNAMSEYDVLGFLAFTGDPLRRVFPEVPDQLSIHFCQGPTGPSSQPETAFIEVRQLASHEHYLMKTRVDPVAGSTATERKFTWPTQTVVRKDGIDPNRLGVVIHLGEDNDYGRNLAPAFFAAGDGALPALVDHYLLILRLQQNLLDSLTYQIKSTVPGVKPIRCVYQDDLNACMAAAPTNPTPIGRGSIVRLRLDLSQMPPGVINVHIEGRYHDQDGAMIANFHFDHQPQCR